MPVSKRRKKPKQAQTLRPSAPEAMELLDDMIDLWLTGTPTGKELLAKRPQKVCREAIRKGLELKLLKMTVDESNRDKWIVSIKPSIPESAPSPRLWSADLSQFRGQSK